MKPWILPINIFNSLFTIENEKKKKSLFKAFCLSFLYYYFLRGERSSQINRRKLFSPPLYSWCREDCLTGKISLTRSEPNFFPSPNFLLPSCIQRKWLLWKYLNRKLLVFKYIYVALAELVKVSKSNN